MKCVLILVLLVGVSAACSSAQTPQPAGASQAAGGTRPSTASGGTQPSTAGGGGDTTLADAALKVKDWCTVMPLDLTAKLVPGGSAPQSQLFPPLKCTVTNQVSVVEISFLSSAATGEIPDTESIPGVGLEAHYSKVNGIDDAYLTVYLSEDGYGSGEVLYVEIAGHDRKDHRDDAIAVAKAVLAKLH